VSEQATNRSCSSSVSVALQNKFSHFWQKMHDVCRLLEVPPTRAHVSRTGRGGGRFGGAEKKKMHGGAHFRGLDTAVSRGGGRTLAHLFRGGGSKNYYLAHSYRSVSYSKPSLETLSSSMTLSRLGLVYVFPPHRTAHSAFHSFASHGCQGQRPNESPCLSAVPHRPTSQSHSCSVSQRLTAWPAGGQCTPGASAP